MKKPSAAEQADPQKPVRVLFVRSYFWHHEDAITASIAELVASLNRVGGLTVDVMALTAEGVSTDRPWGVRTPTWIVKRSSRAAEQAWFLVAVILKLVRCRRHYDVVVSTDTPLGLASIVEFCCRSLGKRHVFWVMDLFALQDLRLQGRSGWMLRLRAYVERLALLQAREIVVLGLCMRDCLVHMGVDSTRIRIIPIWAAARRSDPVVTDDLRVSSESHRQLRILYAGHAARRNPLSDLSRAVGSSANVKLHVYGTGESFVEIQRLVNSEHLAGVSASGPLPLQDYTRVADWADIHVVSLDPRAVGCSVPSKTYSAMARGKPVLFIGPAESQAAVDILTSGGGWVCAPDQASIIAQLADIREHKGLVQVGRRGQLWVRGRRDLAAAVDLWLQVLR